MSKKYFFVILVSCLFTEMISAKSLVDCRVLSSNSMIECNPYGSKLLRVKEVIGTLNRKTLTLVKTPFKKHEKILTSDEMLAAHISIEKSTFENKTIKVKYKPYDEKLWSSEEDVNVPVSSKVLAPKQKNMTQKPLKSMGYYHVVSGDVLGRIAHKFGMTTKELLLFNNLDKKTILNIGEKLKIPLTQKMVDAIANAEYVIESGDTLLEIAHTFNLDPKLLVKFNHLISAAHIREGKKLSLPLPYILKKIKIAEKKERQKQARIKSELEREAKERKLYLKKSGKHKLRVTATAYTSHKAQTDSTPFLAAWNNRLRPGMKIIAVSRDLLTRYGLRNGTRVRIGGLRGYYRVRDKMNKRYKKRIDIYMGLNRKRALRWGKRSVVIYW